MSEPVSVLIAALNDERWIASAVQSAKEAGAAEIIVSDGGSSDRTGPVAAAAGALVMPSLPWRSRQFNAAAAMARHESLIFLHADTTLPPGACQAVVASLQHADFGGFRMSFTEGGPRLRVAAALINLRTRMTRCPWGDQAQFIRRSTFLAAGGFREVPLMEDYELASRMRGRSVVLPMAVRTSGRRFLEKGLLRTALINWAIVVRWRGGADPGALARWYRS